MEYHLQTNIELIVGMIHYVKRKDLDLNKYDACINNAINSRIYGYSWYLDIVADNWDALVLNDYEAVMPLPWRQKYFIKYIYPPAWTQQLGVFSNFKIEADLVEQFVNSIPKKFKKVTIQFNSENDLSLFKTEKRINYILKLDKPYEEIYKGYRKDRKDRLKQVENKKNILRNIKIEELVIVGKCNYAYLKINNQDYEKLKLLSASIEINHKGFLLGVYSKSNQFLGGSFCLKEGARITYLFSVATEIGKKEHIITQVINEVIEEHSNSNFVLDFEGSMIEGVAEFYKSFGADEEVYFLYKNYKLF